MGMRRAIPDRTSQPVRPSGHPRGGPTRDPEWTRSTSSGDGAGSPIANQPDHFGPEGSGKTADHTFWSLPMVNRLTPFGWLETAAIDRRFGNVLSPIGNQPDHFGPDGSGKNADQTRPSRPTVNRLTPFS